MYIEDRGGICRRVVVIDDCVMPAKHEANVTTRMEDDGLTLPPGDWAVEPQGLRPGVMAARTLFSDSQSEFFLEHSRTSPMSFRFRFR